MPAAHRPHLLRFLVVAACAAAVLPVVVAVPAARAEEPPAAGTTVVGELVQAWAEHADPEDAVAHAEDGPLSWIDTGDGEAVRVRTEDVADIETGATVEVTIGAEVADPAAEEGLAPAREVLAAEVVAEAPDAATAAPATQPYTNSVTVVPVELPGLARDTTTPEQVAAAVNGTVSGFWEQQSGGAIRVGVTTTHPWISATIGCNDPFALWAQVASTVGFTEGPGKHLLLYLPGGSALPECAYGLAEIGSSPGAGGMLWVRDRQTSVVAHELGHNFGLGHSSARQCDRALDSGTCRTDAYRDWYDVMGISWEQVGTLNVAQAARIGLLPSAQRQNVTPTGTGGTYTVAPVSGTTGTRGLSLTATDGTVYWLEYRPAAGRDSYLGSLPSYRPALQTGVLLRKAAGPRDTSLLLDGSPSASAGWSADYQTALPVGTAIPVAGSDFTVTVTAVSATGATVRVGTASNPTAANRAPVGGFDPLAATGATLDITGWALDPDDPAAPVQVHLYIDGRGIPMVAQAARTDVSGIAGAGSSHGFSYSTEVLPGTHRVCAYAIDGIAGGGSTTLGCREVSTTPRAPVGNLERFGISGRTLTVEGWTFDPDRPALRLPVHVYVDGSGVPLLAGGSTAPSASPQLAAEHGFSWSKELAGGRHQVCVFALDATPGHPNTVLGCQTFTVVDSSPVGALERVAVSGTDVTVAGWALDPDAPTGPIQVHAYVDGYGVPLLTGTTTATGYPTGLEAHGFTATIPASRGAHNVCVYAIDRVGASGNTTLGCRTVVV